MDSVKTKLKSKTWIRGSHLISTDSSLISASELVNIFGREEFYWSKPMPADMMREMMDNSLVFGLHDTAGAVNESALTEAVGEQGKQSANTPIKLVGIARLITDFITFAYLTDVWVDPACQGQGLGKWLIKCVQEAIDDIPHLRRSMLLTGDWQRSVPFYEKLMGMSVCETVWGSGLAIMQRVGPKH